MHILHYFMYSRYISQILDEYSNLKEECKKDVVHDAFDAIYVSCIDNRSRDFICNFFHLRPVMVDIVRSLPPVSQRICSGQRICSAGIYSLADLFRISRKSANLFRMDNGR